MHTRNHAKKLICPFSNANPANSINCFADGCAAWDETISPNVVRRFICATNNKAASEGQTSRPPAVPKHWEFSPYNVDDGEPAGWVEPANDWQGRIIGRCLLIEPKTAKEE